MSPDTYVEPRPSWGKRVASSFVGVLFGIALIFGAIVFLTWNEGRSAKTVNSLNEGAKTVISIPSTHVDPLNEGRLVHLNGLAKTDDMVTDPEFGVTVNAIHLARKAEMYQWKEHRRHNNNTTTYTYEKAWGSLPARTSSFKYPEGHENPDMMPYQSFDFYAPRVMVDETFELSDHLKSRINAFEPYPVKASGSFRTYGEGYYIGASPENPQVGDMRITFKIVKSPLNVTIVARQSGNSFGAYQTRAGDALEFIRVGTLTAAMMFKKAQEENVMWTWIGRAGGCLAMFIGFALVFGPITALASFLPFVESLVGLGTGLAALVLSLTISTVTVAVAWFAYHPLVSIILILISLAVFVLIHSAGGQKKVPNSVSAQVP